MLILAEKTKKEWSDVFEAQGEKFAD